MKALLFNMNNRLLFCLLIIFSTITTSYAENNVNISVLYDFDTGKPSILNVTTKQVNVPPVRKNESKEEYNNLSKKLGDIIYDGLPAVVVSSGYSATIDTQEILKLVAKNISRRLDSKGILYSEDLYPGQIILIKNLEGNYSIFKIIQINKSQLKVAWITQSKNVTVFSKNDLLVLKNVPLEKQEFSRKMILSRIYNEGKNAIDFSKQELVYSTLPNDAIKESVNQAQSFEKLSNVADIALVNRSNPSLLVASGKMVVLGQGLLSDYFHQNLESRFLNGNPSGMLFKLQLNMVFMVKDRLDNYVLIRITGLSNKNIELHWIYQPNGKAIFTSRLNEKKIASMKDQEELNSKLFNAIRIADINTIRDLIDAGANINSLNNHGHTVLGEAVLKGNLQVILLLCNSKVDVNAVDKTGLTALHMAAAQGNFEAIKILVDSGADINIKNSRGENPLEEAADSFSKNKVKIIKYLMPRYKSVDNILFAAEIGANEAILKLLKKGVDINQVDSQGKSPLILASEAGNIETVKLLLSHGADLSIEAFRGQGNALIFAVREDKQKIVKLFLINKKTTSYDKAKGLIQATLSKNAVLVKMFLNSKTDPNLKINGRSAYEVSLEYPDEKITKLYIERGYKLPLWAAIKVGHIDEVRRLLADGTNVNESRSPDGESNLDLAIRTKQIAMVELLIEYGAKLDSKNSTSNKNTPLHTAVDVSASNILQLLIDKGANLNITNFYERTPLVLAVVKYDLKNTELLLKNNADFKILPESYASILDINKNKEMNELLRRFGASEGKITPDYHNKDQSQLSDNDFSSIMRFIEKYWLLLLVLIGGLFTWLMFKKLYNRK